jgi:serine/threonine protein phosphatase PrpC
MAKNYFGLTDVGKQRSNNEDTFIAEMVMNDAFIAACVIDGVGGYSGGEVAAELARETIIKYLHEKPADVVALLKDAIAAANLRIYNEKRDNKENGKMACVVTLALADVENNKFYYAHVGDTRLYLLRDQSLVKVTKDHSFVGFLEDSGRLSEEAAMRHPKRNEINKALGFDGEISSNADYIETGDSPFLPGDMLLLCSDGLTDMVSNNAIKNIISSGKGISDKAKALINAANEAGGKDNITVVLVHNDKPVVKHEATRPAVTLKKNDPMKSEEVNLAGDHKRNDNKRKGTSGAVKLLTFLFLLVLAALCWLIYRDYIKTKDHENEQKQGVETKQRNAQEQVFVDSIDRAENGEVFIVHSEPAQAIIITDSVLINKDSLHIIGNGVSLQRDSSYTGPAFTVAAKTRYLLLDSLTIDNFDVGVLLQSPGLHLRNVQFKNCRIPVQYQFMFPAGTMVSGSIPDTLFRYSTNQAINY